jgi:ATP-dependent Clp protease ATP-binding subunit ClpA
MNRIDKVVVFRTLNRDQLHQILDLELAEVQRRILATQLDRPFASRCTAAAKDFLFKEGTDPRYGARHLKRAIERHVVFPLSGLISTEQVEVGDVIRVDVAAASDSLIFVKEETIPKPVTDTGPVTTLAFKVLDRGLVSARSGFRTAMR